jgi:hypothetical protein
MFLRTSVDTQQTTRRYIPEDGTQMLNLAEVERRVING